MRGLPLLTLILAVSPLGAFGQQPLIFSPNGDGVKDQVTFKLRLSPDAQVSSYQLDIKTSDKEDGALVKSFTGKGRPPEDIQWNGKDLDGRLVKDGVYYFTLSLNTPAGNQTAITPSPLIVDRVAPEASVSVDPALFSPNGDGIKDETTFTLSGSDANGVYGWLLVIKDKDGAPARNIRGKGAPPSAVKWDGRGDFEEDVPDGAYTFDLTVEDLAGNRTTTPPQTVTINRAGVVSTVEVVPILISPNGDGQKDDVTFRIASGSPESVDRWELKVLNQNGKPVHSFTGVKDPPARIEWNGQLDGKRVIPDGSYQVVLTETDHAGNTASTTPQPLEVDTQPPLVEARLEPNLLSPNGDGIKDEGAFSLKADDAHPLDSWYLKIANDVGKVVRTITGPKGGKPNAKLSWKGDNDSGATLLDGNYFYWLEATDIAMNKAATPKQPLRIDTVPPVLSVSADPPLFSPNGDGILDTVTFKMSVQDAGPIDKWSLTLTNDKGEIVRKFTGPADRIPPSEVWDGKDDNRTPLPDGPYTYVLRATDIAGNAAATAEQKVVLGATQPTPTVAVDYRAISPNADNFKDFATFSLKAPSFNPLKEWSFRIRDREKRVVRLIQGRGDVPGQLQWQGDNDDHRALPDDDYTFDLEVVDVAGNKVATAPQPIRIDTTKPDLQIAATPALFSPNGDGIKDETIFTPSYKDASAIAKWKVIIQDPSKTDVTVFSGTDKLPTSLTWKGLAQDKSKLPDGAYTYVFFAEDEVGNRNTTSEQILRIDTTPPLVTLAADPVLFSPNGDGVKDDTTFQLDYKDASDIQEWKLVVSQGPDKLERSFKGLGRPPRSFPWDGKNDRGQTVPDGSHTAALYVTDEVGNTGKSKDLLLKVDTSKPLVSVVAETDDLEEMALPMTVTESNDKDIVISLASEVLFDTGQEVLKAQAYPTLMKANHLVRRYPQRKVRIEGHADNVPIHDERFKNNVELSEARAEAVMQFFIDKGKIDPARLTAKGYGDSRPRASNDTEEGRRANRRVEIILVREKS